MKVMCEWCNSVFDERYIPELEQKGVCPCCKENGYLFAIEETDNYIKFSQEVLNKLSVTELVWFNQGADNLNKIVHSIVEAIKTEKRCPKCGEPLYYSDLPEYDYVCVECDENFYGCEVE